MGDESRGFERRDVEAVVAAKERHDRLLVAAADLAKGKVEELDRKYSLMDQIDSFSNHEIQVDETVVQSKMLSWWNSAMDSVEQLVDAANRPVDVTSVVEPVETKALDYWTSAVEHVSGLWARSTAVVGDGKEASNTPQKAQRRATEPSMLWSTPPPVADDGRIAEVKTQSFRIGAPRLDPRAGGVRQIALMRGITGDGMDSSDTSSDDARLASHLAADVADSAAGSTTGTTAGADACTTADAGTVERCGAEVSKKVPLEGRVHSV